MRTRNQNQKSRDVELDEDDAPRGREKSKAPKELDLDDVLDGMDEAEVKGGLPKLKGGDYTGLRVDRFIIQDGYWGQGFVIEFTLDGASDNGHRTGQRLAFTINGLDDRNKKDLCLANVKAFLSAVYDIQDGVMAQCKKALNDPSEIEGKHVDVTCVECTTKDGKREYIRANWSVSEFEAAGDADGSDDEAEELKRLQARRRGGK